MADLNFTNGGYTPSSDLNFADLFPTYNLLAGTSNNFISIWAETNASRISGRMYVISQDSEVAFSIMDLKLKFLYDKYTTTMKGRSNETLVQDDPKDMIGG